MCVLCTCVCKAAGVALATSSLCESATACSNMHPELPAPMHFLCLSLSHTNAHTLTGFRYSLEEGGKHQSWHICLKIVSDSAHLDLLSLKISKFCYCAPHVMLFSKLAHRVKNRMGTWLIAPTPSFFGSRAVVQLSVLCTSIGKRQCINALLGHFGQQNGYFETNQLQFRSCLPSVCGGEVELLRWFCSGFDDELPKKNKNRSDKVWSLEEMQGGFPCTCWVCHRQTRLNQSM